MKVILLQPVKFSADTVTPPGAAVEIDDAVAAELIGLGAAAPDTDDARRAAAIELRNTAAVASDVGKAAADAAKPQPASERRRRRGMLD